MSICVGTAGPACPHVGITAFYSLSNKAQCSTILWGPGTRRWCQPVSQLQPGASGFSPPPFRHRGFENGCGGAGSSRQRELLEDGCAALAVQAGGIKEDRDQSPSAPSLRVPRPQLQVHVLANHMFTLSPSQTPHPVSK